MRILGARCGDARFEDLHPQRLVERHHLDAEAAGEPRAHALVERLEIGRRAVGGDHDLAAGIEQRVQRVAELVLERLALQELHVVDDQQIDRPHRLLEGDRGVRLQRGDEAVHEALGGQIDDAAPLRRRGVRGRLEKMGLAEADRRMDVERAEGGRLSGAVFDHALRGGIGELIGAADQERSERQPTIERRTGERFAVHGGLLAQRAAARRRGGSDARRRLARRVDRLGLAGGDRRGGRRDRRAHRRAQPDRDRCDAADLGFERGENAVAVMGLDPALEEARRHRELRAALLDRVELQPPEPRSEDILAEFGAQAPAAAPPALVGVARGWNDASVGRSRAQFSALVHRSLF